MWQKWVKLGINLNGLPRADPNGESLSVSVLHMELRERRNADALGRSSTLKDHAIE